jgi:3-dehydroquinate dehydratase / shikimate dehydrogenase
MPVRGVATAPIALPSRICVSLGDADAEKMLEMARSEAARGESLFEFCLEFLGEPRAGPAILREFLRRWPQSFVIVTCRANERFFHGSLEEQQSLLSASLEAGARGIDLEIESAIHARDWMERLKGRCLRIVSYHNYQAPPPLGPVLRILDSVPADILKFAVSTHSARRMCHLIEYAGRYPRRSIVLAMGAAGLPTRVLGPVAGRSFTYAAPCGSHPTAPGQVDAQTLRQLYRLNELAPDDAMLAGFPGSVSELPGENVYNQALTRTRTQAVYIPWPGVGSIPAPMMRRSIVPTRGISLASPFFRSAMALADVVEKNAADAGTVDTLWQSRSKWIAGWKFGETVLAFLETNADSARTVVVMGNDGPRQAALRRLLTKRGWQVISRSQDPSVFQIDVSDPLNTSIRCAGINFSADDLCREMVRRQLECWLNG